MRDEADEADAGDARGDAREADQSVGGDAVGDVGPDAAAVDESVDGGELRVVALLAVGGAEAGDALSGGFVWVGGWDL